MMDIKNSRRILFLGKREAGTLDIIKDLTGSAPAPDVNGSTAGLTHEWDAKTAYYEAKIPIWIDEVPDFSTWKTDFLKPEAKEVVDAVGAWIYCFSGAKVTKEVEEAMKSIQEVVEEHVYGSDVLLLAVATKHDSKNSEEQDDICMQYGFEYINYSAEGKNEFGEKTGFERMKEALEANEWAATEEEEFDFDADDFGKEEAEMTAELFGMKAALDGEEEEEAGQVDDLDRMLGKLLAVKESSADLPEEQRKRLAAKAVRELMRENRNV